MGRVGPPGVEHFGAVADGVLAAIASRWRIPPATMPDLPPRVVAAALPGR